LSCGVKHFLFLLRTGGERSADNLYEYRWFPSGFACSVYTSIILGLKLQQAK